MVLKKKAKKVAKKDPAGGTREDCNMTIVRMCIYIIHNIYIYMYVYIYIYIYMI